MMFIGHSMLYIQYRLAAILYPCCLPQWTMSAGIPFRDALRPAHGCISVRSLMSDPLSPTMCSPCLAG